MKAYYKIDLESISETSAILSNKITTMIQKKTTVQYIEIAV